MYIYTYYLVAVARRHPEEFANEFLGLLKQLYVYTDIAIDRSIDMYMYTYVYIYIYILHLVTVARRHPKEFANQFLGLLAPLRAAAQLAPNFGANPMLNDKASSFVLHL